MPDGILIIDKPAGWTSMDVCAKLRGILREKRIGHAGTLDPMATGVLPVFVGRATKAVQFAENGRKEYCAVLKLGTVTDTQDTTGAVLEAHPVTVGADEVRAALEHFTGELLQLPPMYSALKVNGQKLYDLARQGKTVERKPRAITVYELELLEQSAPDEIYPARGVLQGDLHPHALPRSRTGARLRRLHGGAAAHDGGGLPHRGGRDA